MPEYTCKCKTCGEEFTVVRDMEHAPGRKNRALFPNCKNRWTRRIYNTSHVIPDDLGYNLPCTTLRPLDGRTPVVSSRSELARVIERHNAVYGTNLEHAV